MERIDFADLVAKNRRWTWILLAASFALVGVVGATIAWLRRWRFGRCGDRCGHRSGAHDVQLRRSAERDACG